MKDHPIFLEIQLLDMQTRIRESLEGITIQIVAELLVKMTEGLLLQVNALPGQMILEI